MKKWLGIESAVWSNAKHLSNLIIMSTRPNNEKMRILERGFNATPTLDRCYPLFRFVLLPL